MILRKASQNLSAINFHIHVTGRLESVMGKNYLDTSL